MGIRSGSWRLLGLFEELGVDVNTDAVSAVRTTDELIVLAGSAVHD